MLGFVHDFLTHSVVTDEEKWNHGGHRIQGLREYQDAILCPLVSNHHIYKTSGKHLKEISLFLILRARGKKNPSDSGKPFYTTYAQLTGKEQWWHRDLKKKKNSTKQCKLTRQRLSGFNEYR